jgi:hypothetical protein
MDKRRQAKPQRQPDDWASRAKGLLKAELVRRGISYQQLRELLAGIGVRDTTQNLTNKINRGKFSAVFLLQCLEAIDCTIVRVKDE